MGEKNIKLGPGELYFNGEPFAGIAEGAAITEEPEDVPEIIRAYAPAEFSASCQLCGAALEHVAEASRAAAEAARQFKARVIDLMLDLCPGRVAHLVRHGKKMRTRKKNWHRALRWVRKMREAK